MPNKLQAYAEQAERTARQITGSHLAWTAFLTTAARLYKYPYNEQLMIYMQRPEATACAEYDFWNEKMGRYVRRGSTGIALIDATGYKPRLKYVFDVSDTGGKENARRVNLWELKDAHTDSVSAMLERNYGVSGKNGLAEQFESVASQLAAEYWRDHSRDILGIVADSYLEEYDDYNIEVAFKNAAAVSITYSLMSRCGMQPEDHFEHEDFFSIFDFNTPRTVAALGTAVSEINEQVLRQIEVTIRNYEREHSAERTAEHGEQPDLHDERRLHDSRPEDRGAGAAPRQVRADAPEVPEGASPHPLEPDDLGGDPVSAPAGDRAGSAEPLRADDAEAGVGGRSDGSAESPRPNEMGGPDEHLQGAGGGSDSRGADLRITEHPARGGQLSFFPTEAEQITAIEEAESAQTPFAFSVSQAQLDHVLRLGGNEDDTRMVIAAAFQKQKSTEDIAERGIVGGRIVDAEANRNSPFIRQVMADVERIAVQEAQAAYMDSPDRFSIRLHPNEGGITGIWDSALDRFYEEGGQVLRFAEQSNAIDYLSSIQRSRGMEPDVPVFTTPLGNAYRVGDGFSSTAAEQRDTLMVVERVDEDNVWYTLPSVPEQETVSVDRTVFERYLDTGYFFATEQTQPVKEITAENEQENMIFRAPYAVGDTVYLDNTPFEITEIGALNVQLRDPALRYPVFRAESRENFERLLRRDERNAAITDYLPERNRNDDLRDLLMNGILTPDIRDEVRELFRQGEGNAAIGAYLSNVFAASDADTMTLEDGTEADFITSRSGFQAQVHGEKGVHALGLLWPDAAPVLRAVFLEEAQAQSRTQAQPEPDISLPEQPASEATEPEQPQFTTETVAFYPGEKSQLPYDIEIQTIRTTEPELPAPQKPSAENFRITDENLGIGGAKAKFRANMAAINLLKELEFEGAQATPEQQEILSRYVGWGGLADAFDESNQAAKAPRRRPQGRRCDL